MVRSILDISSIWFHRAASHVRILLFGISTSFERCHIGNKTIPLVQHGDIETGGDERTLSLSPSGLEVARLFASISRFSYAQWRVVHHDAILPGALGLFHQFPLSDKVRSTLGSGSTSFLVSRNVALVHLLPLALLWCI